MNKTQRKPRSRAKISFQKPVVLVSKSNKNITAQVLEAVSKRTLTTFNSESLTGTKTEKAEGIGKKIASFCKSKEILEVVFYRQNHPFCGRIKAIADTIKENGVKI